MSPLSRLFTVGLLSSFALVLSASATPVAGGATISSHSLKSGGGGLFNSSLTVNSGGNSQASHNSFAGGSIRPHQFSFRVPPPVISETPEPSTYALFGTGLMMLGGAVRRKFRG